jgi:hypothetical protein
MKDIPEPRREVQEGYLAVGREVSRSNMAIVAIVIVALVLWLKH